jgi:hypothetical protein
MPCGSRRVSKLDRLIAAYECLGEKLTGIADPAVERTRKVCLGVRPFIADARLKNPSVRPSQIAAGLEQGLRETPMLLADANLRWRSQALSAFHSAVTSNCPEFFAKDAERFERIRARGKIRTEAEFCLVRHLIDEAEGAGQPALLKELYALVAAFEARGA